jgi:hypothetical protein
MLDVLALLRPARKVEAPRQTLSLRLPVAYRKALQDRAAHERTTETYLLLSAALKGDKQLASLFKQYAATGGQTNGQASYSASSS